MPAERIQKLRLGKPGQPSRLPQREPPIQHQAHGEVETHFLIRAASLRGDVIGDRELHGREFSRAGDGSRVALRNYDRNATILHTLGLDHRRLTFKCQSLDQKLTGAEESSMMREILA